MPISHRFSRLRNGDLRLRVSVTGPDMDVYDNRVLGAYRHGRPNGAGGYDYELTGTWTGPQIDRLLGQLTTLGGHSAQLANDLRARRDLLAAKVPPARDPHVTDDDALRALVRARPTGVAWVLEEFSVQSAHVRADLALIEETGWTGIELKGATDSLTRLPRQVAAYSATFDHCELVTVPKHLEHALEAVPDWWAVTVAHDGELRVVQPGSPSPVVEVLARVQILWRDELADLLRTCATVKGMSKLRRDELAEAVATHLDAEEARRFVTAALRRRVGWVDEHGRHLPMFPTA